jgi:hypothetical protein
MALDSYADYRQAADAIQSQIAAIEAGYAPKHAACIEEADLKLQERLAQAQTESEITAAKQQHSADLTDCWRKRNVAIGGLIQAKLDELGKLEDEANRKLIRLPRMIVAADSLRSVAEGLSIIDWDLRVDVQPKPAPVVAVRTFNELLKVFSLDRFTNVFALLLPIDKGEFVLANKRLSPEALASMLAGTNQLKVSDVLYVTEGAHLRAEPLRAMVGAGLVRPLPKVPRDFHAKANEDELCLPPQLELGIQGGVGFGLLAERYIEQNYCEQLGPCTRNDDYFDDYNPTDWRDFIAAHDHRFWSPAGRQRVDRACDDVGERPDIASVKGRRWEYYEIKPQSPAGVIAGYRKLIQIAGLMNVLEQRYVPGTTYRGATIPIAEGTVRQLPLRVWLEVKLDEIPGLIVYQLCLAGDLKKLLKLMTLAALILIVIGFILASTGGAAGPIVGPLIPVFVL